MELLKVSLDMMTDDESGEYVEQLFARLSRVP